MPITTNASKGQPSVSVPTCQVNVGLLPAANPTLSQTSTVETPILSKLWQVLME